MSSDKSSLSRRSFMKWSAAAAGAMAAAGLVGCQPAEKEEKKEQGHPAQTYETVSYTHLDVYKRQATASRRSRARTSPDRRCAAKAGARPCRPPPRLSLIHISTIQKYPMPKAMRPVPARTTGGTRFCRAESAKHAVPTEEAKGSP